MREKSPKEVMHAGSLQHRVHVWQYPDRTIIAFYLYQISRDRCSVLRRMTMDGCLRLNTIL